MYNEHFGLEESPFSITPDPRYLYMSEQHREALAHLVYGLNCNGGFVLLTGDIGTGKTTVCRCLLEQIPDNSAVAFILNPKLTAEELLATVCDEFSISYPEVNRSIKVYTDLINSFLLDVHAQGRRAVLIIDEAQNLSTDVLEQLRLLTNLETNKHKLLQIILLGQPELREKLAGEDLKQLSQRIIARYHLGPLSKKEVGAYIAHRLSVAGLRKQIFPASVISGIYHSSKGIPRLINLLCDRALLGSFSQSKSFVDKSVLNKATNEVMGGESSQRHPVHAYTWLLIIFLILLVSAVLAASYYKTNEPAELMKNETEKTAATEETDAGIPPVPDYLHPADFPAGKSRNIAYQDLFHEWGIEYVPDEKNPPCSYALKHGLMCEHSSGNMRSLLILNRPAVLRLFNEDGQSYYITLSAVNGETVEISSGQKKSTVSVRDIEERWLGDYTLLWQLPPVYKGDIAPGTKGSPVEWLSKQMYLIYDIKKLPEDNQQFDGALVEQVKQFQLENGLVPDGIVGTRTFIHINNAVSGSVPKLISTSEDG